MNFGDPRGGGGSGRFFLLVAFVVLPAVFNGGQPRIEGDFRFMSVGGFDCNGSGSGRLRRQRKQQIGRLLFRAAEGLEARFRQQLLFQPPQLFKPRFNRGFQL